jgi:hypothetical protein
VDVSRVVPVIRAVDGKRRVGSGYRVAERLVLTAAHCVSGTGHRVRLPDGERAANVLVDGRRAADSGSDQSAAGVDLGVLEIVSDQAQGKAPVVELSPPPCARIDRATAGRIESCVAIGYPRFATTAGERVRTAQVDGWIPAGSGLVETAEGRYAGYLTLKADGVPPAPLPTSELKLGHSAWAGMSGAAVFAGDWLVGVVAEHHLPEGDGSLTVVPIEWVSRLPEADRAAALRALGLGSVDGLHVLVAGATPQGRWRSVLPVAPPALVDRPALEAELRAAVLAAAGSPVVVYGMGGSGKSVLAGQLARAVRDGRDGDLAAAFPDGVAWVQVGQQRQITAVQMDLAHALGEDEPDVGGDWRTGQARLQQLATGRRGLVVLDDVWTLERYEPLRLDVPGVRILVTTRNQALFSDLQAAPVQVGELERDQSRALLAAAAGTPVEELPGETDAVLKELGDLALGVAMVGAIAKERSSQAWAGLLHRLRARRLDKVAHRFQDYEHPTLLRAIDVAVDDLGPDDQHRWAELAVFAGQGPIPQTALAALWHAYDDDDLDTDDRLDRFLRRSLVQLTADGRFQLHDLLYDTARIRLDQSLAEVHAQLLDGYRHRCPDGWASGHDDGYFFQRLPYHLLQAGRASELHQLLLDFEWLQAKLAATDPVALAADYDLLPDDVELRLVRDALRLSIHVLARDPRQLPSQLYGRLPVGQSPAVQAMLARTRTHQDRTWLRPMRSSLAAAGGPLVSTLEGHQGMVLALALTPDGRRRYDLKLWIDSLRGSATYPPA